MTTMNIYDMADTWNDAETTFAAIKMNVTDTASNAASLLMDLQVGGSSRFKVGKSGVFTFSNGTRDFALDVQNAVVFLGATGWPSITAQGGEAGRLALNSNVFYGWTQSSTNSNDVVDLRLYRNAAGVMLLAGGSSTTPGALQLYTYAASPPAAPAASQVRLYADTSGGKIRLMALFPSGAAQQVAIEP